jgi:hypothetical protein
MFLKHIDENGMISLMGPLLLLAASATLLLGYLLFSTQKQTERKHMCRTLSLKSQQIISDGMNELIRMNPKALRLQTKQRRAELMIRRATNPKLLAVAIAYYQRVKAEQKLFHAKQLRLISSTVQTANSYLNIEAARKKLVVKNRIPFLLRPYPPHSDSPMYQSFTGLEKQQVVRITWRDQHMVNANKQIISGECNTSIRKEKEWHPIVAADKGS